MHSEQHGKQAVNHSVLTHLILCEPTHVNRKQNCREPLETMLTDSLWWPQTMCEPLGSMWAWLSHQLKSALFHWHEHRLSHPLIVPAVYIMRTKEEQLRVESDKRRTWVWCKVSFNHVWLTITWFYSILFYSSLPMFAWVLTCAIFDPLNWDDRLACLLWWFSYVKWVYGRICWQRQCLQSMATMEIAVGELGFRHYVMLSEHGSLICSRMCFTPSVCFADFDFKHDFTVNVIPESEKPFFEFFVKIDAYLIWLIS